VQTGFARTGKHFAMEHHGVAADLTTMAKGLAGGFPLAAVTGRADIMDGANPGGWGALTAAILLELQRPTRLLMSSKMKTCVSAP
jgi:4-aminobutyrate aminotransferase